MTAPQGANPCRSVREIRFLTPDGPAGTRRGGRACSKARSVGRPSVSRSTWCSLAPPCCHAGEQNGGDEAGSRIVVALGLHKPLVLRSQLRLALTGMIGRSEQRFPVVADRRPWSACADDGLPLVVHFADQPWVRGMCRAWKRCRWAKTAGDNHDCGAQSSALDKP
jgi:hypothetical protein